MYQRLHNQQTVPCILFAGPCQSTCFRRGFSGGPTGPVPPRPQLLPAGVSTLPVSVSEVEMDNAYLQTSQRRVG